MVLGVPWENKSIKRFKVFTELWNVIPADSIVNLIENLGKLLFRDGSAFTVSVSIILSAPKLVHFIFSEYWWIFRTSLSKCTTLFEWEKYRANFDFPI